MAYARLSLLSALKQHGLKSLHLWDFLFLGLSFTRCTSKLLLLYNRNFKYGNYYCRLINAYIQGSLRLSFLLHYSHKTSAHIQVIQALYKSFSHQLCDQQGCSRVSVHTGGIPFPGSCSQQGIVLFPYLQAHTQRQSLKWDSSLLLEFEFHSKVTFRSGAARTHPPFHVWLLLEIV